jgi:hypothetical protein
MAHAYSSDASGTIVHQGKLPSDDDKTPVGAVLLLVPDHGRLRHDAPVFLFYSERVAIQVGHP